MIFDTHAHYDDPAFDSDRDELLLGLGERGVGLVIDPGCDVESSSKALALSEQYGFVYAAVGFHPEELEKLTSDSLKSLATLSQHPKCVAVGEIGLDYYWDDGRKAEQKALFEAQIQLALQLHKPVIIHDREAHGDCLEIVRRYPELRGVFHCFSGSAEMAKELLNRGWFLGFDGPITYKNARKAIEVLELCPLDRLLIETDSPYLSPVPLRGKRNDSRNLRFVLEKIAAVKDISPEEAERISFENGCRLFGINTKVNDNG